MVTKATTTARRKTKAAIKEGTAKTKKVDRLVIPEPNFQLATFKLVGTAPYVQHKFSEKTRQMLEDKMRSGKQAGSRKTREKRDFDADYRQAMHISTEGWAGMPAPAFRNAMIDTCRLVGFKMTIARCSLFIEADGYDENKKPLVRITSGEPIPHTEPVRNATGVVDIRCRPMWENWEAMLTVKWDGDQFSESDVANLLLRAGMQVGVGEGRPFSKSSFGQGWGQFTLAED